MKQQLYNRLSKIVDSWRGSGANSDLELVSLNECEVEFDMVICSLKKYRGSGMRYWINDLETEFGPDSDIQIVTNYDSTMSVKLAIPMTKKRQAHKIFSGTPSASSKPSEVWGVVWSMTFVISSAILYTRSITTGLF